MDIFLINSRRTIIITLVLAAVLGAWWYLPDEPRPVTPPVSQVNGPAPASGQKERADLEALVQKAGAGTRYHDLNKAFEDALGSGMTQEEQLDLIRRLKESGMDTAEFERVSDMLWWESEDPAFLLKLADVLDAGNKKQSVMKKAFEYVTKDQLPMFTEALLASPGDTFRRSLAAMVIDQILADGDFAFTAKWVESVEGPGEKLEYDGMLRNTLVRDMNNSVDGKPILPIKALTGYFTGDLMFNIRADYGGYYLRHEDYDSLKDIYADLPEDEMLRVLDFSILKAKGISAAKAEELLSLAPESDPNHLSMAIELAKQVRLKDGDAAADAFLKAHPEAVIKP